MHCGLLYLTAGKWRRFCKIEVATFYFERNNIFKYFDKTLQNSDSFDSDRFISLLLCALILIVKDVLCKSFKAKGQLP